MTDGELRAAAQRARSEQLAAQDRAADAEARQQKYEQDEQAAIEKLVAAAERTIDLLRSHGTPGEVTVRRKTWRSSGKVRGWKMSGLVVATNGRLYRPAPYAGRPERVKLHEWIAVEVRLARMSDGSYPSSEFSMAFNPKRSDMGIEGKMRSRLASRHRAMMSAFGRALADADVEI